MHTRFRYYSGAYLLLLAVLPNVLANDYTGPKKDLLVGFWPLDNTSRLVPKFSSNIEKLYQSNGGKVSSALGPFDVPNTSYEFSQKPGEIEYLYEGRLEPAFDEITISYFLYQNPGSNISSCGLLYSLTLRDLGSGSRDNPNEGTKMRYCAEQESGPHIEAWTFYADTYKINGQVSTHSSSGTHFTVPGRSFE